ncbi:Gfo/Idh/MocA family oxidoreductase [Pectobacterium polonicum]|uniref:Gfo/Idh/MocA family protein n=1 Tax=Pectobacterium polonicum TaxID=2485124 RepID=UPI00375431CA
MRSVAVIGLGNIATRHRRNLKSIFPGVTVFAMSASGRMPTEKINDCDVIVSSIEELISSAVQLVIVASPATLHAQHSIPFIKAGIPVLIEKPVTSSLQDALDLRHITEQYQTPVAVGYCLRYLPSAQKMKEYIDTGILGQLYYANIEVGQYLPDWRPNKNYHDTVSANLSLGGGVLLELSHELDYGKWLLGPLSLEHAIVQRTEELALEVEDSANLLMTTNEKAVVHIRLDFLQRKAYRRCRFVGSNGALEWDLIDNRVYFISSDATELLYSDPQWDKNKMYINMILDFIYFINKKENNIVTLIDAIETIEIINSIKNDYSISSGMKNKII